MPSTGLGPPLASLEKEQGCSLLPSADPMQYNRKSEGAGLASLERSEPLNPLLIELVILFPPELFLLLSTSLRRPALGTQKSQGASLSLSLVRDLVASSI